MNYFKTMLLLAGMTALFMIVGGMLGGRTGMMLAFVFAVGTNIFAWWNSDKMALRRHNAREVGPHDAPELYEMVAALSQNANLPTPRVYILETGQPNAFATGRNPENSAVAVTTGLMNILSREELAGVIAHELAHIKNRDTLIMTIAATVAGALTTLTRFGFMFRGSGGRSSPFGPLGSILAVILAPMAAMVIKMMISRTREYSADRLGAEICGQPMWLASALRKISGGAATREMMSAEQNPASAHMFIVNPLSGRPMDKFFSTHPRMENRIAALQEMAQEMGQAPQSRNPWG